MFLETQICRFLEIVPGSPRYPEVVPDIQYTWKCWFAEVIPLCPRYPVYPEILVRRGSPRQSQISDIQDPQDCPFPEVAPGSPTGSPMQSQIRDIQDPQDFQLSEVAPGSPW